MMHLNKNHNVANDSKKLTNIKTRKTIKSMMVELINYCCCSCHFQYKFVIFNISLITSMLQTKTTISNSHHKYIKHQGSISVYQKVCHTDLHPAMKNLKNINFYIQVPFFGTISYNKYLEPINFHEKVQFFA